MSYQEFRPRSFDTLPPVIKNLLIINVLMFATTWVLKNRMNIDLNDILGLHYITATDFRPYQFITYMFMHGDPWHLFFNMFAVWMFGSTLENVWGAKRFLVYYVVTGLGAALIQYIVFYFQVEDINRQVAEIMQSPDSYSYPALMAEKAEAINQMVIIGASGALFGLLLAFGMMFPNTLLYMYFVVPVKAKWFVIGYGVIELISGLSNNAGDNVAHFAHLGGMLFGFFMILIWKRNRNFFY
ncbi:MAG: rhomboid family intramembrane serine protease [Bacteroidia bacterium]